MLNNILENNSLSGLVKIMFAAGLNRVGERSAKNVSITKDASSVAFEFPVICTSDVPEEVMVMMGKFYETKLAMDIAVLLGKDVKKGDDVHFNKLIDSLPYARGVYSPKASEIKKDALIESTMESIHDGIQRRIGELRNRANTDNIIESDGYGLGMNPSTEEFWYEVTDKANLIEAEVIEPKRGALPTQVKIPIKYNAGAAGEMNIKSIDYTFTIKCNIHKVPYRELYTRLASSDLNFTKSWVKFRKNKEYKFIKNLILDLDTIKNKAKYDVNKSSVFKDIEIQKTKRSIGVDSYPFVCFVVSEDFVNELKEKGDADLSKPGSIQKVLKSTMGLAWGTYVGDSINLAFDGQNELLNYSTSEIYKETDRVAKDLRETVKQFKRSSF